MAAGQESAQFHDVCQIYCHFLFFLLFAQFFLDELSLLIVKFGIQGHCSLQIGTNAVLGLFCENVVGGEIG